MSKKKITKPYREELNFYGDRLSNVIIELQDIQDRFPDKILVVEMELDYSNCYYECDTPTSKLIIRETNA